MLDGPGLVRLLYSSSSYSAHNFLHPLTFFGVGGAKENTHSDFCSDFPEVVVPKILAEH